ncbi:hypothetical protein FGB62_28g238 [Gracilaria domingensis]|nr:hypothetical protein FGB62_28g238 [Gracilaria domingensis]
MAKVARAHDTKERERPLTGTTKARWKSKTITAKKKDRNETRQAGMRPSQHPYRGAEYRRRCGRNAVRLRRTNLRNEEEERDEDGRAGGERERGPIRQRLRAAQRGAATARRHTDEKKVADERKREQIDLRAARKSNCGNARVVIRSIQHAGAPVLLLTRGCGVLWTVPVGGSAAECQVDLLTRRRRMQLSAQTAVARARALSVCWLRWGCSDRFVL